MTENKRFSVGLRKYTTQYEIIDNWKTGEYPFIEPFFYEKTAKDLAKFLNALNDENEQLKSLLNKISDKNDRILLNDGRIIQLRKVFEGSWKNDCDTI